MLWLVLTYGAVLDPQQRARLDRSQMAHDNIANVQIMNADYFPRESRVVTFRDPWSFPVLFHPGCNHLIRAHLEGLAQKVWQKLELHGPALHADNGGRLCLSVQA